MRTESYNIYTFDELNETAKDKARKWYRECLESDPWWDNVYDKVIDVAKYLGIEIDSKTETSIGGYENGKWNSRKKNTYNRDCIFFSGFWSQGDGASFYGTWRARDMKTLKQLTKNYPNDANLSSIHSQLWAYAKQYPESTCTSTRSASHYSHARSTNLEAVLGEEIDYNEATHKPLEECLVAFMNWIYRELEEEFNAITSNESIDENIRCNEYEFEEDGTVV